MVDTRSRRAEPRARDARGWRCAWVCSEVRPTGATQICSDFWMGDAGDRIYSACGNGFVSSSDVATDMLYPVGCRSFPAARRDARDRRSIPPSSASWRLDTGLRRQTCRNGQCERYLRWQTDQTGTALDLLPTRQQAGIAPAAGVFGYVRRDARDFAPRSVRSGRQPGVLHRRRSRSWPRQPGAEARLKPHRPMSLSARSAVARGPAIRTRAAIHTDPWFLSVKATRPCPRSTPRSSSLSPPRWASGLRLISGAVHPSASAGRRLESSELPPGLVLLQHRADARRERPDALAVESSCRQDPRRRHVVGRCTRCCASRPARHLPPQLSAPTRPPSPAAGGCWKRHARGDQPLRQRRRPRRGQHLARAVLQHRPVARRRCRRRAGHAVAGLHAPWPFLALLAIVLALMALLLWEAQGASWAGAAAARQRFRGETRTST